MSRPWDNEPPPWLDSMWSKEDCEYAFGVRHIRAGERRLRHAERLLELCAGHTLTKYQEQALSHLEAARLEDGK